MKGKPLLLHNSNFSKFLIFAGTALLSLGVFSILSIVFAKTIYHIPLTDIANLKDTSDPGMINMLKMMQVMQALGLFIVPPLVFAFIDSNDVFNYLNLNKMPVMINLLLTCLLMIAAQPLINWMAELNSLMPAPDWMLDAEKNAAEVTKIFLKMNGVSVLIINLIVIAFLPALGEELLFRGIVQGLVQKATKNNHLAIWISAILFSALHMQFLGFFPRMLMGAAFGYLLYWSGSLWLPVVGHFVNNAGAVIISFMIQKKGLDPQLEDVGTNNGQTGYVILSFVLIAVILFLIRRYEKTARIIVS